MSRRFKLVLVFTLLSTSVSDAKDALSRFAIGERKMQEFTDKCVRLPTENEMETDVHAWIEESRKHPAGLLSVTLDGFPFQKISEPDLQTVRALTIPRGAQGPLKSLYRVTSRYENHQTIIERSCVSAVCGARGKEKKYDLSAFKGVASICGDSLCGLRKIFGETKGLFILWSYLKFGTNLSPLSDSMADPAGLDRESMKAIIAAAQLLPGHLRPIALKDSGFYRFLKGQTLPIYKGQKVVANSFGGVFDPIDDLSFTEKVYFFIHELAHRARLREEPAMDESPTWLKASGWKDLKSAPEQSEWASRYAMVNPFEDFAETYALYRLDPARLKRISLDRYQYMKEKVFDGIEYDQDLCQGSKRQD